MNKYKITYVNHKNEVEEMVLLSLSILNAIIEFNQIVNRYSKQVEIICVIKQ